MVPEIKKDIKSTQPPARAVSQPANPLPTRTYPLRVKFEKTGQLQYISHLDLNRTLSRGIVRAGVPVWYTEGFNPHPKLIFAAPLSVGIESVCEFCDIKTTEPPDCEKIKSALLATMPEGLRIVDVYTQGDQPLAKFSTIAFSEYRIKIYTIGADEGLAAACDKILRSPLKIIKRSKRGEGEIDLSSLIARLEVRFDRLSGEICIETLLPADSANYTNPELLVGALSEHVGILHGSVTEEYYSILRTQLYLHDKITPFK